MNRLAHLFVTGALLALSYSAYASGYLQYSSSAYTDNDFSNDAWKKYMSKYDIPVQTGSSGPSDRTWYWVSGYQHCFDVFLFQRKNKDGKLVDLILAGQEEAKKFEEDLNQAIAPLDATPSEEKAKFKIKNGLISDRIAVPYIVKDSDVGTVSIEMHYIKTEAGLTHTCPY
jgi:hypothetical protein